MRAIITVANPLKAAGRTSAVVHLGTELALRGYRTLVIDLDHQADLTYHFVPPDLHAVRRHSSYFPKGTRTLTDVLVGSTAQGGSFTDDGDARLDTVLTDTVVPLLWLAPSTLRLGLFNMSHALAVTRLAAELDTLRERFEFVLIDTPRSQTRLLEAALFASTHLLVTAAPHSYIKRRSHSRCYGWREYAASTRD
jgi:chromosome partitioning protein